MIADRVLNTKMEIKHTGHTSTHNSQYLTVSCSAALTVIQPAHIICLLVLLNFQETGHNLFMVAQQPLVATDMTCK